MRSSFRPTDKRAFIESFNGSFRDECLNVNWFLSLDDAKEKIEAFKDDYNGFRPHSALCGLTPNQVIERHQQTRDFLLYAGTEKVVAHNLGGLYL